MFRALGPFNVPGVLLIPQKKTVKGVLVKSYKEADEIMMSFRTFSNFKSEEKDVNGNYTVVDTGTVQTWYRPDIKSDCRIKILETGEVFDILGEPEDISMRHQFLQFQIKKVGGAA